MNYDAALNYTIFQIHIIREMHPPKDAEQEIAELVSKASIVLAKVDASNASKVVLEINRMLTDMPHGGFA